jgi:hypothetical protein
MSTSGIDKKPTNVAFEMLKASDKNKEIKNYTLKENYVDLFKLYIYYLTMSLNGPRLPTYNTIRFAKRQLKFQSIPQGPHPFAPLDKSVKHLFEELSEKLQPYFNYNFVEEEFKEKHDISDEYCHRDLSCVTSQIHLLQDIKNSMDTNEYKILSEEKKIFIKTILSFFQELNEKNHLEEILNSKNLKFFGEMIYC